MDNKNYSVCIYTLGCKVNQYESEAIAEAFEKKGVSVNSPDKISDAYVINTCTVTAESDRKARQFIRRAIKKNPSAVIAVTGCMAQTSSEEIASIEGVDIIVGNTEKLSVVEKVISLTQKGEKSTLPSVSVTSIEEAPFECMSITHFDRTRAYVKIEDGCESHCTYCIIPAARGKIRSKSPEDVISEVKDLTLGGCKEVVLTGIETASYGKDLEDTDLGDLLALVDSIENIGRVRLGSLDPSLITPAFVKKISSLRSLAPHFHLSLQSGSDKVLALMKRKYNSRMALRAIELLRENIPDVKITTDIIVGFPYESEEDFEATLEFLKKAKFLMVHVFPYSKRKGTPAAAMKEQITSDEKSRRVRIVSEAASEIRKDILSEKIASGRPVSVLFETFRDGKAYGHTPDFVEVWVNTDSPLDSKTREVALISTDGETCFGEIID